MTTATKPKTIVRHCAGSIHTANGMTVVINWIDQHTTSPRLQATVLIEDGEDYRCEIHTLNCEETKAVFSNTEHHREYAAKYHDMIS